MELSRIYLQRGWIIQHKANSWCGFVVTVASESLDCTAMTWLPYGSISPGRGKWSKIGIIHFFVALLWPNGSTFSTFQLYWRDFGRYILKISLKKFNLFWSSNFDQIYPQSAVFGIFWGRIKKVEPFGRSGVPKKWRNSTFWPFSLSCRNSPICSCIALFLLTSTGETLSW